MNPIENMELWNKVKKQFEDDPFSGDMEVYLFTDEENCNTVGCIAGWTVRIARPGTIAMHMVDRVAANLLGIKFSLARGLFHLEYWPQDLLDLYDSEDNKSIAILTAMGRFERGEFVAIDPTSETDW